MKPAARASVVARLYTSADPVTGGSTSTVHPLQRYPVAERRCAAGVEDARRGDGHEQPGRRRRCGRAGEVAGDVDDDVATGHGVHVEPVGGDGHDAHRRARVCMRRSVLRTDVVGRARPAGHAVVRRRPTGRWQC